MANGLITYPAGQLDGDLIIFSPRTRSHAQLILLLRSLDIPLGRLTAMGWFTGQTFIPVDRWEEFLSEEVDSP